MYRNFDVDFWITQWFSSSFGKFYLQTTSIQTIFGDTPQTLYVNQKKLPALHFVIKSLVYFSRIVTWIPCEHDLAKRFLARWLLIWTNDLVSPTKTSRRSLGGIRLDQLLVAELKEPGASSLHLHTCRMCIVQNMHNMHNMHNMQNNMKENMT